MQSIYDHFEVLSLWLMVLALCLISVASFSASNQSAECVNHNNAICRIAIHVYDHPSYFQSAHILVLQFLMALSLIVVKPWLRSRVWKMLENPISREQLRGKWGWWTGSCGPVSLETLHKSIQLSTSPSLVAAVLSMASHTINLATTFAIFMGLISIFTPLMVSPIYKKHQMGNTINETLGVGGGMGDWVTPEVYKPGATIQTEVQLARALLTNLALQNSKSVPNYTTDPRTNPFLLDNQTGSIWETTVTVPVVRSNVLCDSGAYNQLREASLLPDDRQVVEMSDTGFWSQGGTSNVTIARVPLGQIDYGSIVSLAYLKSDLDSGPGWLSSNSSVVLLGSNVTLEGAQERLDSPVSGPTDLRFVDVLVCNSTVRIEFGSCFVQQGKTQFCGPPPPGTIPSNASDYPYGGLETALWGVGQVAKTLASAPVWSYPNLPDRLPKVEFFPDMIESKVPPRPYLSSGVTKDIYPLPQDYILDVLFYTSQHYLIQGFVNSEFSIYRKTQPVQMIANFATSDPRLQALLLSLGIWIASVSTILGRIVYSPKDNAELDLSRILAISRNNLGLDGTFEGLEDRHTAIPEKIRRTQVSYGTLNYRGKKSLIVHDNHPPPMDLSSMKGFNNAHHLEHPNTAISDSNSNLPLYSEGTMARSAGSTATTFNDVKDGIESPGEDELVEEIDFHQRRHSRSSGSWVSFRSRCSTNSNRAQLEGGMSTSRSDI